MTGIWTEAGSLPDSVVFYEMMPLLASNFVISTFSIYTMAWNRMIGRQGLVSAVGKTGNPVYCVSSGELAQGTYLGSRNSVEAFLKTNLL